MNKILQEIEELISKSIKETLPDITPDRLEKSGAVFYMNGNNGTEFDWYVNNRLSNFMVFYNDKDNLGIAKASVYDEGDVLLYLYDDQGQHVAKEIRTTLDVSKDELRTLALTLRKNADDIKLWDADIGRINCHDKPTDEEMEAFISNAEFYAKSIEIKVLMNKLAVVSKKIIEDGWKVGYMSRGEAHDDQDSGWMLYAGDESEEYSDDAANFSLCYVNSVADLDQAIMSCIDLPVGTNLIRVSSDKFEEDNGQEIHMEKWKES